MAAGGGLTLEERRDRAADPVCADASHAGAGSGPGGSGGEPGVRGCANHQLLLRDPAHMSIPPM